MTAPAPAVARGAIPTRFAGRGGRGTGAWFDEVVTSEILVVGGGAAGLTAALGCAPRSVTLLTKAPFGEGGSTSWAQGGIAAAVGEGDAPARHAADTLAAADGLGDREATALVTGDGPARIAALLALGARFDRAAGAGGTGEDGGRLALGREAAHGRRRIVHARGDATGAELMRVLAAAVGRAPEVRVAAGETAIDLVLTAAPGGGGRVAGVLALGADGRRRLYLAGAVVLATGGIGRLYLHTTNPVEATGDGLAMAARAGARLVDLEFVQFHPTALALGGEGGDPDRPMPLATEALRGAGAVLIDGRGRRFLAAEHPEAELAPRDVVARAIWRRLAAGERVYLDARAAVGEAFPERFPTVWAACRAAGIDPRREPMPVAPAAHYHMGGIATDLRGRTSLAGLWACGEVASTGLHGANRLASNSLLEALVLGARVAADLRPRIASLPGARPGDLERLRVGGGGARTGADGGGQAVEVSSDGRGGAAVVERVAHDLRRLAWERLGLVRDGAGLAAAQAEIELEIERLSARQAGRPGEGPEPPRPAIPLDPAETAAARCAIETANLLTVGRLVAAAARARRESRGAHFREDFPAADPAWRRRLYAVLAGDGAVELSPGPPIGERSGKDARHDTHTPARRGGDLPGSPPPESPGQARSAILRAGGEVPR